LGSPPLEKQKAMANSEHVEILKQGVVTWNKWREKNAVRPDLSDLNVTDPGELPWLSDTADSPIDGSGPQRIPFPNGFGPQLTKDPKWGTIVVTNTGNAGMDLAGANFDETDLSRANLDCRCLHGASFGEANLTQARFNKSDLSNAQLTEAIAVGTGLKGATLRASDLSGADFSEANLTGADLSYITLVQTKFRGATITGCRIYGASVWEVDLEGAVQGDLVIHPPDKAAIEVDDLELAQFIYLLLNNKKIRQIIDTITSKVVLILGRFTPERKPVLDSIREELRNRNYVPVLFDFEKPTSRDLTETISTLAHMARFVIADITDAKSIPQELQQIIPDLPSVPVQPLLLASQEEYGMFEHFRRYSWVLAPVLYENQETLLKDLVTKVIAPAENKAKEQTRPPKSTR
jgi:hypothetical protein